MRRIGVQSILAAILTVWLAFAAMGSANAQTCAGSCNGDQRVTAAELTRMVAIILLCNGNPQGCEAVPGGCVAGDADGNGLIEINDLMIVIGQILTYADGCPPPPPTPTPTETPEPTATETSPPPSDTPEPTATDTPAPPTDTPVPTDTVPVPTATQTSPPPTATATATATIQVVPGCGNGVVEAGEECDDGGICVGSDNAGTSCTGDAQCPGGGVCVGGTNGETLCQEDSDCPGGTCVSCRPFGGDGCAANCTNEREIPYALEPGKTATGSRAFLHTAGLQLNLRLKGSQNLQIGKRRDGIIPVVVKAEDVSLPAIPVSTLACACVRGIAAKRCGGAIYESGTTLSPDCTITDDCAALGKKPCAFIHGPGNSASGVIGCDGLSRVDATITQEAGTEIPRPVPPTPPSDSGPSIITLSGSGGPGSAQLFNTSQIGQTAPPPGLANVCDARLVAAGDLAAAKAAYGEDLLFCTDDDPLSVRGNPNTLPLVTGRVTGTVSNGWDGVKFVTIGPDSMDGVPFNCAALEAPVPSVVGVALATGFTSVNQPTLGDMVVTNIFVGGPTPTPKP